MKLSRGATSMLFGNKNPDVVTESYDPKRYNRQQRRSGTFCVRNNKNGLFVKRVENTFKDRPLEDCSIWSYSDAQKIIALMLVNQPRLNLELCMVYKEKGQLVTI